MIVRPEIAALRDNDVPQRQAQDALHAAAVEWRGQSANSAILADFRRFAEGNALEDCPALAALFVGGTPTARGFAHGFVGHFAPALAAHPLAHMPQRHFHDAMTSTLALARHGPATLTLLAIDGTRSGTRAAAHASFWPGEAWETFLAGRARGEIVRRTSDGGPPRRRAIDVAPMTVITRDAAREALVLCSVSGLLVSLRLQRRASDGRVAEEVALATGEVVHRAAGSPRDSRLELMMATLGRMEWQSAAPHCAAIALSQASASLRWQALRETLALDTATGLRTLTELADRDDDPLQQSAFALQQQLIARHPQLAGGL